ncbi:hypothetical protein [Spirosoma pollinicola]|uniref:hypothetical protein n=1 Tax=Spirosoma pollinicola TaxID=2057025 RepID=UPI0012FD2131|nr:hypothetical protein [Spirosoma pollinicola]
MNLYNYKPQPREYRQSPSAEKQLSTTLQGTLDALSLRQESLTNFAIGFAPSVITIVPGTGASLKRSFARSTPPA